MNVFMRWIMNVWMKDVVWRAVTCLLASGRHDGGRYTSTCIGEEQHLANIGVISLAVCAWVLFASPHNISSFFSNGVQFAKVRVVNFQSILITKPSCCSKCLQSRNKFQGKFHWFLSRYQFTGQLTSTVNLHKTQIYFASKSVTLTRENCIRNHVQRMHTLHLSDFFDF